ncbi:unnamed protein product [Darwinula stevensoni]|uniref:Uncharacterized protein n=1 Tax=Darwinula stevensoni TaxID=69355 RepID=A0A7R8X5P5_9CRUS|nr:unnamed protein product [Darwinula stevensoni]CAG0880675.1 unnamed protein product [Darwinula stevensoni]
MKPKRAGNPSPKGRNVYVSNTNMHRWQEIRKASGYHAEPEFIAWLLDQAEASLGSVSSLFVPNPL